MELNRILVLTALGVLAAGMSRADVVPGHFTINLNDGATDGGGWGSGTGFQVTVNPSDVSSGDFTQTALCTYTNEGGYAATESCDDPSIRINGGGASDPLPASFNADENGGGIFDYFNQGPDPITSLLLTTDNYPDSFFSGKTFTCSSDLFAFCGFRLSGDPMVQIFFTNGTIPSTVPEPTYGVVFLAASGLLVWARKARRSKV